MRTDEKNTTDNYHQNLSDHQPKLRCKSSSIVDLTKEEYLAQNFENVGWHSNENVIAGDDANNSNSNNAG